MFRLNIHEKEWEMAGMNDRLRRGNRLFYMSEYHPFHDARRGPIGTAPGLWLRFGSGVFFGGSTEVASIILFAL
jgi:hypothetical protein